MARTISVHSYKALPLISGQHTARFSLFLLMGDAAASQKMKTNVYLFSFDNTSCMSDINVFSVLHLNSNPDRARPKI